MADQIDANPFLARMYGTFEEQPQPIGAQPGDDTEKLAQLQVIDELLQAENIDVEQLSVQDLVKVAGQMFGPNNVIAKMAEGEVPPEFLAQQEKAEEKEDEPPKSEEKPAEEKEEEAKKEAAAEAEMQEKIAFFDFCGRLMAHSFNQENKLIEKQALSGGQALQAAKNWAQLAGYGAGRAGRAAAGGARAAGGAIKGKAEAMKETFQQARAGLGGGSTGLGRSATGAKGVAGSLLEVAKKHPKTVAGLAAVPVAGGAAYGLSGGEKKASALDMLAERRAEELAAEFIAEQQAANPQIKLAAAVEERAMLLAVDKLRAAGVAI